MKADGASGQAEGNCAKASVGGDVFMTKASTIIKELEKYCPEIIIRCRESLKKSIKDLDFLRLEKESYEICPNISLDKAVMEKTDLGYVFPLEAKWSDIGSWESYWENSLKDSNDLNDLMNASCTMSSAICRSLTNLIAVEINLD